MLNVPGSEVAERSLALVLVLDTLAPRDAGGGRQRPVLARSRLDRRFLITTDHEVTGVQQLALPAALVEVEDPARLGGELGVAREDPGAVLPGLDRVFREPAPDSHAGDPLADPARHDLRRELGG